MICVVIYTDKYYAKLHDKVYDIAKESLINTKLTGNLYSTPINDEYPICKLVPTPPEFLIDNPNVDKILQVWTAVCTEMIVEGKLINNEFVISKVLQTPTFVNRVKAKQKKVKPAKVEPKPTLNVNHVNTPRLKVQE